MAYLADFMAFRPAYNLPKADMVKPCLWNKISQGAVAHDSLAAKSIWCLENLAKYLNALRHFTTATTIVTTKRTLTIK